MNGAAAGTVDINILGLRVSKRHGVDQTPFPGAGDLCGEGALIDPETVQVRHIPADILLGNGFPGFRLVVRHQLGGVGLDGLAASVAGHLGEGDHP